MLPRLLVVAAAVALWSLGTAPVSAAPAKSKSWRPDRFLVTFWCPPPPTDAAQASVAADGYNLTWVPEAGLDVAARHGLRAMLQDDLLVPAALDDPARRAKLDALVDRVRKHPALEAYYLTDEPGAGAFADLGRLVAYLRGRDPAHLAYINLFPTYANNQQLGTTGDTVTAYREHLRRFVETVKPDLISYDHYHFFQQKDGDQYFLNLGMIRDAALAADKPFLNIIQACTIEKVWRLVKPDELRFLVYTTLAYGGRGISYFLHSGPVSYGGLYQDGVRMPLADAVASLNREIAAFGPELMKLRTRGVYHAGPLPKGAEAIPAGSPVQVSAGGGSGAEAVLGLFSAGKSEQSNAVFVANRRYDRETVVPLRFTGRLRRVEEFDRVARRWVRCQDVDAEGGLRVTLKAGDGRLFRWAAR